MASGSPVVAGYFDDRGLLGGDCRACGRRHFPRADHCPWCGAAGPAEARLATTGHLWAWTAVNAAPPGYEGPVPFGFGVVELVDDGLHVVTLLTEADPARLHLGQAMAFTVVPVGDDAVSWAFAPRGERGGTQPLAPEGS